MERESKLDLIKQCCERAGGYGSVWECCMMGWDVAGGGGVVGERQSGQQVDDVAFPARPSPSSCPQSARTAASAKLR